MSGMAPRDVNCQRAIDELANALQVAVLIAEHFALASSATAQDATALTRHLNRATDAIQKLRADGSGE